MFDRTVREVMKRRKLLKAAPEERVDRIAQRMAAKEVGAALVVEGDRLLGIFTERDLLVRVVAKGLDPHDTRLADVMTPDPLAVDPDKPFGYALAVMHDKGFRHLPVVEDGKPVGVISSRSALDPDLEEFTVETSRREHYERMGG